MNNSYECVVIFTPVLSEDDAKKQVQKYKDLITEAGGEVYHEDHWGLKQLAYPIQKKTTGIYHIYEFKAPTEFIDKMEISFRRDENVMRFLNVKLDKYALDYNERKRKGEIGRKPEPKKEEVVEAETPAVETAAADAPKAEAPANEPNVNTENNEAV